MTLADISTIERQTREELKFERIAAANPKSTNWNDAESISNVLAPYHFGTAQQP
jgi:hypothetical protein